MQAVVAINVSCVDLLNLHSDAEKTTDANDHFFHQK